MKKYLSNIRGSFLLLLFLFFFGSNTFFNHTHEVDGFTIVHSHPYRHTGNGLPGHTHTPAGFLLFQFLAAFSAITALILTADAVILSDKALILNSYILSFRSKSFHHTQLFRGPPVQVI
ncbi:MAG TPA: hypothetical protein VMT63_08035 [Bacteroidales bacterium]|nr:hypothetical protein [Bacteroidales bacterium]